MEARFTGIILMSGDGRRLGGPVPKQFQLLGDKKVYLHTLEVFLEPGLFDEVILVTHPEWVNLVREEVPSQVQVISGGVTRQASSLIGITTASCDYVVIHDGVRPFVSREILEKNKAAVVDAKAVNTCIPSADTIVHSGDGKVVKAIPPRRDFLRGQTPQTFEIELIRKAHAFTKQVHATDDCSLVLEMGHPIEIVGGDETNMKITTEFDNEIANFIYRRKAENHLP